MSNDNTELLNFEVEIDNTSESLHSILYCNLKPVEEKKINQMHCLPEQKNHLFDTNAQKMNNCHGEDVKNVRYIEASTHRTNNCSEMDLNQFLNLINSSWIRKQYLENWQNQSIDEFFDDFYEIYSSEMETSPQADEKSVATLDRSRMLIFPDLPKNCYSNGSSYIGFNFNLPLLYIDDSDLMMLESPGVATSFPSHLQPQYESFNENKVIHSYSEPTVIQHSNGQEATEFSQVNADTLENGHHFNLVFEKNCDVASGSNDNCSNGTLIYCYYSKEEGNAQDNYDVASGSKDDNSFITLMKIEGVRRLQFINEVGGIETIMYFDEASNDPIEERVQCIEYINDSGEMHTAMYVDQGSNDQDVNTNVVNDDKYEIIYNDSHQSESADSTLHNNQITDVAVENVDSNGKSKDARYQPDLLSSLLINKNNKVTIIAKPLKNPKIRQDKIHSKFEEIDRNTPNIPLIKRPTTKRCRKQKLELINGVDMTVVEPTKIRGRPKKIVESMQPNATFIHETPKRPSKYRPAHLKKTKNSKKA